MAILVEIGHRSRYELDISLKLMKSAILKRSVIINGHRTSVSLESDFWEALKEIAHLRQWTAADLIAEIDSKRQAGNLSSAVRLHVLSHFQGQSGSE